MRNPKDFWTGIIYIAFGSGAIIMARDYGMGTARKMGAAYFPVVLSVILIVIGLISLLRSFLRPGTPVGRFPFRGLMLVTAATALFGLIVRGAGMVIALPVLVIVSAYASRKFSWRTSIYLSVLLTVLCILIFLKGLGIPLPILGSWFGS
ncbi:MAG: small permease of tripartite tricarboxylate transporter [Thermodesulfovibrio sp.]|nr:small permease of tripartite tricarboxylate transporter [Thermodesulfovibrio sp.]